MQPKNLVISYSLDQKDTYLLISKSATNKRQMKAKQITKIRTIYKILNSHDFGKNNSSRKKSAHLERTYMTGGKREKTYTKWQLNDLFD